MALTKVGKEGITGISNSSDANAITIDSSENVLVGKTATNYQSVGIEAKGNGSLWGTADGNNPLILVRKSSDGAVAQFYKDTTNVGSIGSKGGDLTIGTGAIGVRFEDSTPAIVPFDTGTLGGSDNDIDLGKSSVRWNDLYLGGGLYVGGTGSSNKLEDYEEGTWTPTAGSDFGTFSNASGVYTKVGDIVYVAGYFAFTGASSSANRYVGGAPFTPRNVIPLSSIDGVVLLWGDTQGFAFFDNGGTERIQFNINGTLGGTQSTSGNYRLFGWYHV